MSSCKYLNFPKQVFNGTVKNGNIINRFITLDSKRRFLFYIPDRRKLAHSPNHTKKKFFLQTLEYLCLPISPRSPLLPPAFWNWFDEKSARERWVNFLGDSMVRAAVAAAAATPSGRRSKAIFYEAFSLSLSLFYSPVKDCAGGSSLSFFVRFSSPDRQPFEHASPLCERGRVICIVSAHIYTRERARIHERAEYWTREDV